MGLTPAQKKAIAARGNVLVSAGAGTGKTRTLAERCLSCLLEERPPVSLDQILVVTFTEAAATEIRQRIRSQLEQELNRRPNDFRWHEQLALFDTAHIGTLHSFCLKLIRPHFYELEIDPQVGVLAESEARLISEEVLTKVLERHYQGSSPGSEHVQQLIQEQARGSDVLVRKLVFRLHHYTQTLPDPEGWFREQLKQYGTAQPIKWHELLLTAFSDWRQQWLPFLAREMASDIERQCDAIIKADQSAVTRAQIVTVLQKLVGVAGDRPTTNEWRRKNKFDQFLDEVHFLLSLAEEGEKTDPLAQDWQWVQHQMMALLNVTREFGRAFSENKRQLGMLDFHDLEQNALRLLWNQRTNEPTPIALQFRERLRFVFVDEYQDINAAQDKIIEALSGEGPRANRFLVGDIKQSIYRFRQAAPHIFQNYMSSWQDEKGQTIALRDNFRSREAILNFINSLFSLIMHKELGGVEYDEKARLQFGEPTERASLKTEAGSGPRVELQLRIKGTSDEVERDEQPESDGFNEILELEEAAKEARLVALRLRELKAEHHLIWDENRFRPIAWGDMAVLLRAPSRKSESYAKEFARLNIPLHVQRGGFYESIEILDLTNLLRLLDNPLQDIPVLAVLHSPLAGLTVNELATIRLAAKGQFWTALILWHDNQKAKSSRSSDSAQSEENSGNARVTFRKVSIFLDRYARWRRLARQSSLSRCLESVLSEAHYEAYLLSQPRGEQRLANVQRLLRLAQQFDTFQRQGLFRFLNFIDAQKRTDSVPEVEKTVAEDSVRLMSIHQSKGLEFPLVVLADLSKPFNQEDLRAGIILDEKFGLCPQIKPPHTGKRYPSLPYWLAKRRQLRELLGEELRLLYVAMTRARDTLILSASISKKRFEAIGGDKRAVEHLDDARCCFDWIARWLTPAHRRDDLLRWITCDDSRLTETRADAEEKIADRETQEPPETWARLQERLSWQYPFQEATRTPAKASVTTLRRQSTALLDEESFRIEESGRAPQNKHFKPEWHVGKKSAESKPSATDIGSAHHRFLQRIALERTGSVEELKSEVRRLQRETVLSAAETELLNLEAIADFWKSQIGKQICAQASYVRRELQFTCRFSTKTLAVITGESGLAAGEDEFLVVQGVVDLAVLNPDEIWIVDFKTDVLKDESASARASLYEPQMKLYSHALSQIYKRPVTGAWFYFLDSRKAVQISIKPVA